MGQVEFPLQLKVALIGVLSLMLVASGCVAQPAQAPPQAIATLLPTDTPSPSPIPPTPLPSPTASLTPLPTLTETPGPPTAPPLSPDAITPETVERLEVALTLEEARGTIYGVDVSWDGGLVASGSSDRKARLYDGINGTLLHTLEHHKSWVYAVALSPDGTRLVTGSRDTTVQMWETMTGQRLFGARTGGEVFRLAFAPDGSAFSAAALFSAVGETWQTETGASLFLLEGHATRLRSVAYSPDGRWLATGDQQGVIALHDPHDGSILQTFETPGGEAMTLAFAPDGMLLAAGMSNGDIAVRDVISGENVASWRAHGRGTWGVAFTPDGRMLISAGLDGATLFWNAGTFERIHRLPARGSLRSIAISADGATLVTGGDDGRVRVWRIAP